MLSPGSCHSPGRAQAVAEEVQGRRRGSGTFPTAMVTKEPAELTPYFLGCRALECRQDPGGQASNCHRISWAMERALLGNIAV